jgi:hypothetical protein
MGHVVYGCSSLPVSNFQTLYVSRGRNAITIITQIHIGATESNVLKNRNIAIAMTHPKMTATNAPIFDPICLT